jgi:hypothetical protein
MSYLDQMMQQYVVTALGTSSNPLHDTSRCDKCHQRVVQRTNSKGTGWRDAVHEMDEDCPEGDVHEVADPEKHSEMLDGDYDADDIDSDALDSMREDCTNFVQANREDLAGISPGQAGHDFWMSRNGHGTGFWDRGLGAVGDRLHRASQAKPYGGESDLYLGDNEKIYTSN